MFHAATDVCGVIDRKGPVYMNIEKPSHLGLQMGFPRSDCTDVLAFNIGQEFLFEPGANAQMEVNDGTAPTIDV